MSFSHVFTFGWTNGGTPITKSLTVTGGQEVNIDETIAASQTDTLINCALDISELESLLIVSSAAITLETNSGSSPADTIVLQADKPLIYCAGIWTIDGTAVENPFDADVTALYATTGAIGAAGALLQIRALLDATP